MSQGKCKSVAEEYKMTHKSSKIYYNF